MVGPKKIKTTTQSRANGTTQTPPVQSPTPVKSPAQTLQLTEEDKENVKRWLDDPHSEFKVTTAPMSKKRKRGQPMSQQTDLFDERLNVQYEVKPSDKWECLRRYKKFTVGSESIATGQCVLVKHEEDEAQALDPSGEWKAKVLEVRAHDTEHVYIRVAWLNRPEDLQGGRKEYHGKYELIPTNQMDIIDAMTVNGPCNVERWNETDDDSAELPEDQFFWRQTYDYVDTKTFSDLRKICIDDAPVNPDELILQCANKDCRKWQHVKCIAIAGAEAASKAHTKTTSKKSAKKKAAVSDNITINSDSPVQAKAEKDGTICEVMIDGQNGQDGTLRLETTNADGVKSTQDVQCLFCKTKIE